MSIRSVELMEIEELKEVSFEMGDEFGGEWDC